MSVEGRVCESILKCGVRLQAGACSEGIWAGTTGVPRVAGITPVSEGECHLPQNNVWWHRWQWSQNMLMLGRVGVSSGM